MNRSFLGFAILLASVVPLSGCGMMGGTMARMMGDGDKWNAMLNMDAVMDENGLDMAKIMAKRNLEEKRASGRGRVLFTDSSLGSKSVSCNSCHPNGGSTGRDARVSGIKLPIPSLEGAATSYPKYDRASDAVITLQMRDNNCLVLFMDGDALDLDKWDSFALAQYVTSFSNGKAIQMAQGR